MTRIILLFLFLSSHIALSQNLEVWTDEKGDISCPMGSIVETNVSFRNNSDQPVVLQVKKLKEKLQKNQGAFFKLGHKMTGLRNAVSQNTYILQPGETSSEFVAYFSTGFHEGKSEVTYRFFNKDKKSDYQDLVVSYNVSASVKTNKLFINQQINISFMYPNPASQYGEFAYKLANESSSKAEIALHNVLGSEVGRFQLPYNENI
ncbi:MAG: hypothetical protein ACPGJS_23480, partial [Flammeovirgaceae bacterium]